MTKTVRTLLTVFIIILVASAGLGLGYFLRMNEDAPPNRSETVPSETVESRTPNHKTYRISSPSRGKAIKKTSLIFNSPADGLEGTLESQEATDIKLGQTAILYDRDNHPLNALASVAFITPYRTDGKEHVRINLLVTSGKLADMPPVRADIVTERINDAERLPESAIFYKDGMPFLWEINKNVDGTASAYIKRTNILFTCGTMAVINTPASRSNVFILDPDRNLRDGDKVNTRDDVYSGAEYTEDEIVTADIETHYPTPLPPDPYTGPEFTCGLEYRNTPATQSRANAVDDFISKIHALSKQ